MKTASRTRRAVPLCSAALALLPLACGAHDSADRSDAPQDASPGASPGAASAQDTSAPRTIELGDALSVSIVREGTGRCAREGSELLLQYEGRTEDAETSFVTTRDRYAAEQVVLDPHSPRRPIDGLARALVGLKQGTRANVHVPAHLAYGARGLPAAGIGPHADLLFDVELVEVR